MDTIDDRARIERETAEAVARRNAPKPAEPLPQKTTQQPDPLAADARNGHPVRDDEIDRRARLQGQNAATDLEQAHALENQGIAQASANTLQRQPALPRDGDA